MSATTDEVLADLYLLSLELVESTGTTLEALDAVIRRGPPQVVCVARELRAYLLNSVRPHRFLLRPACIVGSELKSDLAMGECGIMDLADHLAVRRRAN